MNLITLSDAVLRRPGLEDKVSGIIKDAMALPNATGEQLWATLVYSGVSLGAEESERLVLGDFYSLTESIKTAIELLDSLVSMVDDPEAIKKIADAKQEFLEARELRESTIRATLLGEFKRAFKVTDYLMNTEVPISALDPLAVELAGFRAAESSSDTFRGWTIATRNGSLASMRCRCPGCIQNVVKTWQEGPDSVLDAVAIREGGIGNVMHAFGTYLATELRREVARVLSGDDINNPRHPTDVKSIASTYLQGFRMRPEAPDSTSMG